MEGYTHEPSVASCAIHPTEPAVGTCERCGNYMCPACQLDARLVCPPCRDKLGTFHFSRERYSVAEVFSHALSTFQAQWQQLVLGALIVFGISILVSLPRTGLDLTLGDDEITRLALSVPLQIIEAIVNGVINLGFIAMCLEILEGRPARLELVVSMWHKAGTLIVLYFVLGIGAIVLVGIPVGLTVAAFLASGESTVVLAIGAVLMLLVLVPLTYVGLGTFFSTYEIAHDEIDAIEALRRSWRNVHGQRWPLLGASIISVGVMIAGVAACCVGLLAAQPIVTLFYGGLFLALRTWPSAPAAGPGPYRSDEAGSTSPFGAPTSDTSDRPE
jgi:hypothetical protein